jgi:23S rRNA (uridine2552-2'-O)-methyltransferase
MGRRFMSVRRRDPYYRAAQSEGLRSRAAFKLQHLATQFRLFKIGDRVLDLGAAPGGWSLVAQAWVGPRGHVTAVDPREIEPIDGIEILRRRVGDPKLDALLAERRFDVVLSDMSPRISGAYATDHARSVDLVRLAFGLAERVLEPGGRFVAKVFEGDLLPELEQELRPLFVTLRRTKPPASREPSSELYVVGLGFQR